MNDAIEGNWEWGDPIGTAYQPENDATPAGVNCWITQLTGGESNGDVDGGTTTLFSVPYDISSAVSPVVQYARWFTNDQGAAPGEGTDAFRIAVTYNEGTTWSAVETVGAGTPLNWVRVDYPLVPTAGPVTFRFTAADLGEGSLVEAGVDDFQLVDRNQGCIDCSLPAPSVTTILMDRVDEDAILDWTADPAPGTRFVVYGLSGPDFSEAVRLGTSDTRTFIHEGAATAEQPFNYRVTAVDACGNESN